MPKAQQNRMMFAIATRFAAVIRSEIVQYTTDCNAKLALIKLAAHMAGGFAIDNPNFNRERFLKACGVLPN